jgi:heterodisulfide reductase subunit C
MFIAFLHGGKVISGSGRFLKRRCPEEVKTAVEIPKEYLAAYGNKVYAYEGKILTAADEAGDRAVQILMELEELDKEFGLRAIRELTAEAAERAGAVSGLDFEKLKAAKEKAGSLRKELRGLNL